eukprot:g5302.t1
MTADAKEKWIAKWIADTKKDVLSFAAEPYAEQRKMAEEEWGMEMGEQLPAEAGDDEGPIPIEVDEDPPAAPPAAAPAPAEGRASSSTSRGGGAAGRRGGKVDAKVIDLDEEDVFLRDEESLYMQGNVAVETGGDPYSFDDAEYGLGGAPGGAAAACSVGNANAMDDEIDDFFVAEIRKNDTLLPPDDSPAAAPAQKRRKIDDDGPEVRVHQPSRSTRHQLKRSIFDDDEEEVLAVSAATGNKKKRKPTAAAKKAARGRPKQRGRNAKPQEGAGNSDVDYDHFDGEKEDYGVTTKIAMDQEEEALEHFQLGDSFDPVKEAEAEQLRRKQGGAGTGAAGGTTTSRGTAFGAKSKTADHGDDPDEAKKAFLEDKTALYESWPPSGAAGASSSSRGKAAAGKQGELQFSEVPFVSSFFRSSAALKQADALLKFVEEEKKYFKQKRVSERDVARVLGAFYEDHMWRYDSGDGGASSSSKQKASAAEISSHASKVTGFSPHVLLKGLCDGFYGGFDPSCMEPPRAAYRMLKAAPEPAAGGLLNRLGEAMLGLAAGSSASSSSACSSARRAKDNGHDEQALPAVGAAVASKKAGTMKKAAAPKAMKKAGESLSDRMIEDTLLRVVENSSKSAAQKPQEHNWPHKLPSRDVVFDPSALVAETNSSNIPAKQPRHFTLETYQLRPEQLRELSWMKMQESANTKQYVQLCDLVWREPCPASLDFVTAEEKRLRKELKTAEGVLTKARDWRETLESEANQSATERWQLEGVLNDCLAAFPQHVLSRAEHAEATTRIQNADPAKSHWSCSREALCEVLGGSVTGNAQRQKQELEAKLQKYNSEAREQEVQHLRKHYVAALAENLVDKEKCKADFVEMRVEGPKIRVRGGILNDQLGYGKTCLAIALMDETLKNPPPPATDRAFFHSRATLVVMPSHLLQQWHDEIEQFVGHDFLVTKIATLADLKRMDVRELCARDVVLCNSRVFDSAGYRDRVRELVTNCDTDEHFRQFWNAERRHGVGNSSSSSSKTGRGRGELAGGTGGLFGDPEGIFAQAMADGLQQRAATSASESPLEEENQNALGAAGVRQEVAAAPASASKQRWGLSSLWENTYGCKFADLRSVAQRMQRLGATEFEFPVFELFYFQRVVADELHEAAEFHPELSSENWNVKGEGGASGFARCVAVGGSSTASSSATAASASAVPVATAAEKKLDALCGVASYSLLKTSAGVLRGGPAPRSSPREQVVSALSNLRATGALSNLTHPNDYYRLGKALISLQKIKSSFRWALSGTLPKDERIVFNQFLSFFTYGKSILAPVQRTEEAFKTFVRSNTLATVHFDREDVVDYVRHSKFEHAIYLDASRALKNDGGNHSANPSKVISMSAAESRQLTALSKASSSEHEKLLKLCSHFLRDEHSDGDLASVEDETARLKQAKERAVSACVTKIRECCRKFEACLRGYYVTLQDENDIKRQEMRTWRRDRIRKYFPEFQQQGQNARPVPGSAVGYICDEIVAAARCKEDELHTDRRVDTLERFNDALEHYRQIEAPAFEKLTAAVRDLKFFNSMMAVVDSGGNFTCDVCLEESHSEVAMFPCAHYMCKGCAVEMLKPQNNQACPNRCPGPRLTRLDQLYCVTVKKDEDESANDVLATLEEDKSVLGKYGSKIKRVVELLSGAGTHERGPPRGGEGGYGGAEQKTTLRIPPEDKVILFVQWEDLKRRISRALDEFGVPHMKLQGSTHQKREILRKFKSSAPGAEGGNANASCTGDETARVLILSMEDAASGANLTVANHVFLIHPFHSDSDEVCENYEKQAVGRVLRYGQKKPVKVWRFVTRNTVEEEILKERGVIEQGGGVENAGSAERCPQ